jgi:hypothetical protein
MSVQWIHDFIDSRILDDRFAVEEFVDFKAVISSCDVPLFRDMQCPWTLSFDFDENDHFKWKAIEYDEEDDLNGTCVLEGVLQITKTDHPKHWNPDGLDEDEDVPEFIKSVFPKSEIEHVSVRNVFIINGEMIDFDYMKCDSGYIYLEFVESN